MSDVSQCAVIEDLIWALIAVASMAFGGLCAALGMWISARGRK